MSNQLQFELWRECNCKCTFCTIHEDVEFTQKALKLHSLQIAIDRVKTLEQGQYEVVGFIGGEFFQGQLNDKEVFDKFCELITITNKILNDKIIKNIWINVSLLIGDQKDLYHILNLIDQKDKLWLLSSYDPLGRFHTEKMKQTWEHHLKNIHELYPEININITSILTGALIKEYLSGALDLKAAREKYHCTWFFKNPVKPGHLVDLTNAQINEKIGEFFPKRSDFISFLKKFAKNEGMLEYDKIMSLGLRANEVRKNYNEEDRQDIKFIRDLEKEQEGEEYLFSEAEFLKCGHNDTCLSYSDCDKCMMCDKKIIRDIFLGKADV